MQRGALRALLFAILALLLAIPLTLILAAIAGPGDSWSHIVTHVLGSYVLHTVQLVALTCITAVGLGFSLAWMVHRYDFPLRGLVSRLLVLPLAIPAFISSYAWRDLAIDAGMAFSGPWALGFVLTLSLYPYAYLAGLAALQMNLQRYLEQADSLAVAHPLRRVVLPLLTPALVGAGLLISLEVINEFGAAEYLGVPTISVGIFRAWTRHFDLASARFMAVGLYALVVLLLGAERILQSRRRYHEAGTHRPVDPLRPRFAWALTVMSSLVVMLALVMPLGRLATQLPYLSAEILQQGPAILLDTLFIGVLASLTCIAAGLLVVMARRAAANRFVGGAVSLISNSGYALPGMVAAIGALSFGSQAGGVFGIGGMGLLVLALTSRYAAMAVRPLSDGVARVSRSHDEAARSLGAHDVALITRVILPRLGGPIAAALTLVVIDVLKDLPLPLVLRPMDMSTLALRAHQLAMDERLADASLPSLMLVAITIPLVWVLHQGLLNPLGRTHQEERHAEG